MIQIVHKLSKLLSYGDLHFRAEDVGNYLNGTVEIPARMYDRLDAVFKTQPGFWWNLLDTYQEYINKATEEQSNG